MQVTVVPWPSRLTILDRPAMQLDERTGNSEPEPAPLMALGELVLDLLERAAELRHLGLRDADAGVLDGELDDVLGPRQMHIDVPPSRREFDRVGQQVEEHLLQRAAVGFQHRFRPMPRRA